MKARVEVKHADRAKRTVEALAKRLRTKADRVLVGVQKGAGNYDDGTPIAVIAAANHFGATMPNGAEIPARPFLDVAISKNQRRYSAMAKEMVPEVLNQKRTMTQVLDSIGLAAAADVQGYMVELQDPPNSPITIARKGSANPLIDTGHLRQSIRHQLSSEPVEEGL